MIQHVILLKDSDFVKDVLHAPNVNNLLYFSVKIRLGWILVLVMDAGLGRIKSHQLWALKPAHIE